MKETIISFLLCLTINLSFAQRIITKDSVDFIFKETLQKSRNAFSNATNNWRYDNSNGDYFKKDTLILNTSRSYKTNYCKGVNWSFYKEKRFVLEFADYCNEPPTKRISKKEDYMKVQVKQRGDKLYLRISNRNGLFEVFEILDLRRNQPLVNDKREFNYTIVLVRQK